LVLLINVCILSSTKLEIRAEQFLLRSKRVAGEREEEGEREEVGGRGEK
jgi:hypothetical protein